MNLSVAGKMTLLTPSTLFNKSFVFGSFVPTHFHTEVFMLCLKKLNKQTNTFSNCWIY